jgi:hypothetical protein
MAAVSSDDMLNELLASHISSDGRLDVHVDSQPSGILINNDGPIESQSSDHHSSDGKHPHAGKDDSNAVESMLDEVFPLPTDYRVRVEDLSDTFEFPAKEELPAPTGEKAIAVDERPPSPVPELDATVSSEEISACFVGNDTAVEALLHKDSDSLGTFRNGDSVVEGDDSQQDDPRPRVGVSSFGSFELGSSSDKMPEQTGRSSGRDFSGLESGGKQSASDDGELFEADEEFSFRTDYTVCVEELSDTFDFPKKEELPPTVEFDESSRSDISYDFV